MILWLYRAMRQARDGKPVTGESGATLGARSQTDISVSAGGIVRPGTGGMSVTPRDPNALPRHRKPFKLGGRGRDPVFMMDCAALPNTLYYAEDSRTHGTIQPGVVCQFADYQARLHGTREHWEALAL